MPIRAATARGRPRRSQSERRAESDRLLLLAASELIAVQGYGATTLEQIGRRAGYSRGLVTQKFGSKEGLVRALVTLLHHELDELLDQALAGAEGLDAVLRIVDAYVGTFTERELQTAPERVVSVQAYYVLMSESVGVIPEIRQFFVDANIRFRARLEKHLEIARGRGAMRANLSAGTAAAMIQSALSGLTLLWLVDRNTMDLDEGREALVETIRRTLVP